MKAVDPMFAKGVRMLDEERVKVKPLREKITDEVQDRQLLRQCNGMEGEIFLQKGSTLRLSTYEKLIATLKKKVPHLYKDVEEEHRGFYTITKRNMDMFYFLTQQ